MPDKKTKQPNRIPFESITQIDRWPLPSMGADGKVVAAAKKAQQVPPASGERIEDVTEPVVHKPLTAEQLRQITEEAEREGYDSGFAKGETEGLEQGRRTGEEAGRQQAYQETLAELEAQRSRLQQISAALMEPLESQDQAVENIVVDMAAGLARHLLGKELKSDISGLYGVVERALASLPMGASHIQIFLNPDDVEFAEQAFAQRGKSWAFLADARLTPGGCRIESDDSVIDFSVERRLRDFFALVKDGVEDSSLVEPVVDYRAPEPTADSSGADAAVASEPQSEGVNNSQDEELPGER